MGDDKNILSSRQGVINLRVLLIRSIYLYQYIDVHNYVLIFAFFIFRFRGDVSKAHLKNVGQAHCKKATPEQKRNIIIHKVPPSPPAIAERVLQQLFLTGRGVDVV